MIYVTFELPSGNLMSVKVNPNQAVYFFEQEYGRTLMKFADDKFEILDLPIHTVKEELESGFTH